MRRFLAALLLSTCSGHNAFAASASDEAHIVGPIDDDLATKFKDELETAKGSVIVRINTPGGDLDSALNIAQSMEEAKARGLKITCVVDGFALSAGFYVLESCPVRVMTNRSVLMAHEPWIGIERARMTRQMVDQIKARLDAAMYLYAAQCVSRMHMTVDQFLARISAKEWWITPGDALLLGAVDQVVPAPNVHR